jgi:hypothetical protein
MTDAVALLGGRVVAYRPILRTLGISSTIGGTLLASQLLWLYEQADRKPFHVTDAELAESIGVTVDEIRGGRKDVIAAGFFSYSRQGIPAKGFYDVDEDALLQKILGMKRRTVAAPQNPCGATVREIDRTSAVDGPNQSGERPELSMYGELLEEEIPPVSPKGGAANGKVKAPGRKRSGIELTPDLLPATLSPVTNSLCRWWNTAKTGKRSQEALVLLLSDLERIRVEGGIEAVAEQIQRAIEAKVNGKGWQSISHRNWIRFAPPQQRQQAQERQRAMEPTGEQREILDLAARHPSLFQAAQQGPDGRVIVHFTHEAIEAATQARGSAYPASTTASIVSALEAEIAFLRGAMAHVQVGQGLDNCVCPF